MSSDCQASDVSTLAAQVEKLSNALVKITGNIY
jgi:outer membrane murein-binding lipoprotein Lpp